MMDNPRKENKLQQKAWILAFWISALSIPLVAFAFYIWVSRNSCTNIYLMKFGVCKVEAPLWDTNLNTYELQYSVLWMAPFFSSSGYGSEALSYVSSLSATRFIPSFKIDHYGDLENHAYWNGLPHETKQLLMRLFGQQVKLNETIVICHSEPGAWYPPLYQTTPCPPSGYEEPLYTIGRTMFETDRLTEEHVRRCNKMDEVWVPTSFNEKTFIQSGVLESKVLKVEQTVDVNFFDPVKYKPLELAVQGQILGPRLKGHEKFLSRNCFVFLSIFKWEERKGWDVLLRAYLQEFSAVDNVALYLVTNAFHTDNAFVKKIVGYIGSMGLTQPSIGWPAVFLTDSHVPQVDLPRLYKAANAFVLPSRGEGWGRPHVEAMSMELPVIATNWSGTTEYMLESNSYPLPIDGMKEIIEGPFKGHFWAEPSVSSLQKIMRHVFSNPLEAKAKGKAARMEMVNRYAPEIVAKKIREQLLRIQKYVNERRAQVT